MNWLERTKAKFLIEMEKNRQREFERTKKKAATLEAKAKHAEKMKPYLDRIAEAESRLEAAKPLKFESPKTGESKKHNWLDTEVKI